MAERSSAGSSTPGVDRPARRKKKKKKRKEPAGDRPAFAAEFPRHPDIDRLLQAFEAGNFAYVRSQAPRVIEHAADDGVRQAARDLRRRIDPEPTSLLLWALGVALLVFLYGYYLSV